MLNNIYQLPILNSVHRTAFHLLVRYALRNISNIIWEERSDLSPGLDTPLTPPTEGKCYRGSHVRILKTKSRTSPCMAL